MKTETQASTQNSSLMTNSFLSSDSKYGGLVKKSTGKILRNSLLLLIGYIDSSSPHFLSVHIVITYFRIFQLLGPAIFAASERIWQMGELQQKIVSYVSVVYHIVPIEYRYTGGFIIEIIYIFLIIFYFCLILSSAFIYKNTSKLPKLVVILISIFNGTVMYIAHPVAIQMASQEVSRLIMGMDTYCNKILDIILIALTYILALFYLYMFAKVISLTLLFRPTSLLSTLNVSQLVVFSATYIVTFLSGISTYLSKIPYVILTIITAIVFILTSYSVFMPASFVRSSDMRLVLSSCATGGITCLIVAILAAIEKQASMIVLFVIIAIFVIAMIASFPIIDHYEKSCLKKLDLFADNTNINDHFHDHLSLIRDACIGYKYAHPTCLDWSIFKGGSEQWPNCGDVWSTFGKFVAIYPEENNLLSYIIRNIETKKIKGALTKQTIAQGRMVLTQRDTALSSQLKRKMQHVGKAVHHSKRKLRHIWDLVIQGNTHEMENAVNNAYKTINKTDAEFIHVLSEYPNNRFIARSYARFIQEVKADVKAFHEWVEKVKILQRGVHANVDNTHILGIEAFPNLPHVLAVTNEGKNIQVAPETESAFSLEVEIEDDTVNENMSHIREQINSLTIPSLQCVSIMTVAVFILFIVVPVIVFFFVANNYTDSLNKPLEFMYYMSYLRTLANQLPSFSFHSIFENLPEDDHIFEVPDVSDISLSSFGHYTNTKDQYNYMIKELTINLEALGQFRSYGIDKELLQPATDRAFKSILDFKFFTQYGNYTELNVSIQTALMDYSIQLTKLSSLSEVKESTLNSPIVMNPLVNTETINNAISFSIEAITAHLKKMEKDMNKMMLIIFIALTVFFAVFYSFLTYFEMKQVQSNKHEIFSCLTSLPKNVVSALAESLRVLKKDTEGTRTTEVDTEFSKQEDNILKLFAAAGDDTTEISSDKHVFVACNVVLFVVEVVITYLLTQMFNNVTKKLVQNGPHLNYVFGTIAYMMEAMNSLNIALAIDCDAFNYTKTSLQLLESINASVTYFNYYYQRARYGGTTTNDPPFPFFSEVEDYAAEVYMCADPDAIPTTNRSVYRCFSPDQQTTLFIGLVNKISMPVILRNQTKLVKSEGLFTDLWYISAILLYQSFFDPIFESLLPQLESVIEATIPDTLPGVIVLVIVAFIVVIVMCVVISFDKTRLKFALSLLLHCQSNVIMQTQKIIDVLGGHFTSRGKESTTRNQRFFTEVVGNLPDSIIIVNNQLVITAVNKSTERIYGLSQDDLINTKINDFLSSSSFSDNMSSLITNATPVAVAVTPTLVRYSKDLTSSANHLELSCVTFNNFFVLTTRDVTRMFVYNTLIEEERAKSDKLLASILPPSMVERVQKGEKNISFAVQSATILFLDIVSFTPWCASNTAAMVMQTLNKMFKLMDNKLATHHTATKIKCIGDCYMCAGGIFAEVNQPNVHAKEITEFGLESIGCIRQLDEEDGLQLQIRVGINTGGPIVAGVLGTEKPTFEILGPAINMAQQMEHHGVPMQVHISRSVYELVYGGAFVIKERGQVEIKSGKVITYLVMDPNTPQ